ncbi:MAG: hypothetical protein ABIC18_05150 [Candidatus Omnitrophota bacterium]
MKKWQKILVIIVIIFFGLGIIKNPLIKTVVTNGASFILGAKVQIEGLSVGVFRQAVQIKGFRVYNPKGFPEGVLIDINEVSVEYDLAQILKGKLHLPLVILDLKEMILVRNKQGELNVDSLKVVEQAKEPARKDESQEKKPVKQMAIQIDEARLNLGKVVVKDYTGGESPVILAYNIGVTDKVYKDIRSAEKFATLLMLEAMGPAGMKGAAIYGAATVLGVAFLPAGIAGILIGEDSSTFEYRANIDQAYKKVLGLIKDIGEVSKEDKDAHLIKANVYGSGVTLEMSQKDKKKVEVKVTARQMMIPKQAVAEGIMYQISKILE